MYLLYDDKTTTPISYFGLSIILHGLAVFLITNVAMKMAELKPLKKEVIEFELATKAILQPVVPGLPAKIDLGSKDKDKNLSQSELINETNLGAAVKLEKPPQEKSLRSKKMPEVKILQAEKMQTQIVPSKLVPKQTVPVKANLNRHNVKPAKAIMPIVGSTKTVDPAVSLTPSKPEIKDARTQEGLVVPSEDYTPQEDFNKMEFKGTAWHEDADTESAPEVKEQVDADESLKALDKKYESSELESDLTEADKKNAAFAKTQEQKLADELAQDSKALSENTERYIENEKKKKFSVPPKKQSTVGIAKLGSSLEGGASQSGAHSEKGSANVAGIKNGGEAGRNSKPGKSVAFGHSVNGGSTQAQDGVRALRDLRQMPGNIKPQYSLADRRASKHGDVVYNAFIGSDGRPERFVLIKSSGHQSLDQNTLLALKKWRFYPGQEGWVEVPFRWSLTGGATEAPSLLRR
jgi:TonB family protein